MAVPESTVWDRDPHTEAKHRVLHGYFDAWYPIILSTFPRLTVLEGYAGPGVYTKSEDGSPVIAIRALVERPELLGRRPAVRFVFIEEREDRLQKLQEVVNREFPRLPPGVRVDYHHESCERVWETALDQADAWGMPIFANLDPFGPGVPYPLVKRLGANRSSEALVTFMSDWLRRFWSLEELDDGDVQFGSRGWRTVGSLGHRGSMPNSPWATASPWATTRWRCRCDGPAWQAFSVTGAANLASSGHLRRRISSTVTLPAKNPTNCGPPISPSTAPAKPRSTAQWYSTCSADEWSPGPSTRLPPPPWSPPRPVWRSAAATPTTTN